MRCSARRRSLLTLPAAVWLSGCAAGPVPGATSAANRAAARASATAQAVAPGVYQWRGAPGEMDVDNGGRIGNSGFIVGDTGVLVVDSGSALRHGQALLAAVRQVTDKPVRGLLLTHARQEFVFGAAAFRAQGVPVLMGRRSAQLMAARCDGCLRTLRRVLGEDIMRGTELVKPDVLVDDTPASPPIPPAPHAVLAQIGRPLRLLSYGHSSGPGDTAVLDERSGLLFAGGMADVQRIPDIQDADLPGWHRALDALRQLPLRGVLPGHGPVGPAESLAEVQRYLTELDVLTRQLAVKGLALSEVPDAAHLPRFAAWDQYDTVHRRNASILFLRHERQLLNE